MSQEPLPPPYTSSNKVLNGIAAAFSVFNNPRGLECLWNGPYGQTFRELVDSYADGQFLVYSPYKLWLPGLVRKEQLLRAEFADLGIEYDIIPSVRVCEMKARARIKERISLQLQPSRQTGSTQRTREFVEKKIEKMIIDAKIEEKVKKLREKRLVMIKKQVELSKKSNTPGGFDDSIESNPDTTSFEQEPDIVVTLIATAMLPDKPKYSLRAFRKPYFQRAAILAELKKGASRSLKGKAYVYQASRQILKALNDMIDYCSAYFACYPDAMSVIAFVAGGQMWRWANIKRSETPRWDFLMNTANRTSQKNVELLGKWNMLFKVDKTPFQLGTPESDEELTIINQKHLCPLLAQTPPVPDYLLPREGEESENEDDGAQEGEEDEREIDEEEEVEEEEVEEEVNINNSEADEEREDWRNDRGRWSEDDN